MAIDIEKSTIDNRPSNYLLITLLRTLWRVHNITTWCQLARNVMFTRCDRIGSTSDGTVVQPTRHQTVLGPVLPGRGRVTTFASVTTWVATWDEVFGRDLDIVKTTLRCDTNSIGHRLDCAEGPTRSARALIANLTNSLTLRPRLSGIERIW